MINIKENERSLSIDLISYINNWANNRNVIIKRAGGEITITNQNQNKLFPDIILYSDSTSGAYLQGWEIKLPDTDINDSKFILNAKEKADSLGLKSFLLWNIKYARLYTINNHEDLEILSEWRDLSTIQTREEVFEQIDSIYILLDKILEDLVIYFSNGSIKSTTLVDSISIFGIDSLIKNNIESYSNNIKDKSNEYPEFSDDINIWWKSNQYEYPTEDKYIVLAKINLLTVINKFLFIHLIKKFNMNANEIDKFNTIDKIKCSLEFFENISKKLDFWNIFVRQLGDDIIPNKFWENILEFNNLLIDSNIQEMTQDFIQELIDNLVIKSKRKIAGQFTTPQYLSKFLVKLTIRNKNSNVIDPCCGTGTILREIINLKKEDDKLKISEIYSSTWGSDKFGFPLQLATFSIANPENKEQKFYIFKDDVLDIKAGMLINIHKSYSGDIYKVSLPLMDYVVSNLPFIKSETYSILYPNIAKEIREYIRLELNIDLQLNNKGDFYSFLPFYFVKFLSKDGVLGLIISNSWQSTKWGKNFISSLRKIFHIDIVITSGSRRWFKDVKIITNIMILRKINNKNKDVNLTKYVTLKGDIEKSNNFEYIVSSIYKYEFLNNEELYLKSYKDKDLKILSQYGIGGNGLFSDCSWVMKLENKVINVNQFFDINRGERRGWDKLFYPEVNNHIEKIYLKPFLKNLKSVKTLTTEANGRAFSCILSINDLEKLNHFGAIEWIKSFENLSNTKGKPLNQILGKGNKFWYSMSLDKKADFTMSLNPSERIFIPRMNNPSFINQRLIGFSLKHQNVEKDILHALLNSFLTIFYIEALGFGRGDSVLDLNKDNIEKNLMILNPLFLSNGQKNLILNKFQPLLEREVFPITKELVQKDRIEFEDVVLRCYGLSGIKRDVINSLLQLVNMRLNSRKLV